MFTNITYKQKLIGLVILSVLLFITANKRSYSVTKQTYNQVKELEEKLNYVNASSQDIDGLQNELAIYDRIIGKQGIKAEDIQQKILDYSTQYNTVGVVNLEEIHIAESNGFTIISNQLIVEGDFNSLLELVYSFETDFNYSNIVSVSFTKEKEYQTREDKLRAKIIFQNYEKTN